MGTGSPGQKRWPRPQRPAWSFCMLRWLISIVWLGVRSCPCLLSESGVSVLVGGYRITIVGPQDTSTARRSAWGFCMLRWVMAIVWWGFRSCYWLRCCSILVHGDEIRITTAGAEFNIDSAMLGAFVCFVGWSLLFDGVLDPVAGYIVAGSWFMSTKSGSQPQGLSSKSTAPCLGAYYGPMVAGFIDANLESSWSRTRSLSGAQIGRLD